MTLDLTKPVRFRGFDYEIEQVIERDGYLLVLYVDPVIGHQHIHVSRSGVFTDRDTQTRSTYLHAWDIINVPEPPKEVWVALFAQDEKHTHSHHKSRAILDQHAEKMLRRGWTLVSRRRVEMTEGVFDE